VMETWERRAAARTRLRDFIPQAPCFASRMLEEV